MLHRCAREVAHAARHQHKLDAGVSDGDAVTLRKRVPPFLGTVEHSCSGSSSFSFGCLTLKKEAQQAFETWIACRTPQRRRAPELRKPRRHRSEDLRNVVQFKARSDT